MKVYTFDDFKNLYALTRDAMVMYEEGLTLEAIATRCGIKPQPHISGSGHSDPTCYSACEYLENEKNRNVILAEYTRQVMKIENAINTMPDSMATERTIMRHRYIMGRPWRAIEHDMNYSIRQLQRYHDKALRWFGIMEKIKLTVHQ